MARKRTMARPEAVADLPPVPPPAPAALPPVPPSSEPTRYDDGSYEWKGHYYLSSGALTPFATKAEYDGYEKAYLDGVNQIVGAPFVPEYATAKYDDGSYEVNGRYFLPGGSFSGYATYYEYASAMAALKDSEEGNGGAGGTSGNVDGAAANVDASVAGGTAGENSAGEGSAGTGGNDASVGVQGADGAGAAGAAEGLENIPSGTPVVQPAVAGASIQGVKEDATADALTILLLLAGRALDAADVALDILERTTVGDNDRNRIYTAKANSAYARKLFREFKGE